MTWLLWLHFIGLGMGAVASFGLPVVGRVIAKTPAEARGPPAQAAGHLSLLGRAGGALLVLTGLAMLYAGAGTGGRPVWFWIKMLLVIALFAGIFYGLANLKKAKAGDPAAAALGPKILWGNMAVFLLILLTATLAFG